MTDLKNGIIDVDGFIITPKTTRSDFETLSQDKMKVEISKRGNKYYTLLTPVIAGGISMYIDPNFNSDGTLRSLELNPVIPSDMPQKTQQDGVKNALECSKRWLKAVMDVTPTNDIADNCLSYSFSWGYVITAIYKDRDYGIRGGYTTIRFNE